MLEYLSRPKVLYPYYPFIELHDLREENARLQNYRELARSILCSKLVDFEDITRLARKNLLPLIDDPNICDYLVLTDLLITAEAPSEINRILNRMRTWGDFDWSYLRDTIAEVRNNTHLPSWYQAAREICIECNR